MNYFGCYHPFLVKALKTPQDQSKLVGERWHSILKETLTSELCRNNQLVTWKGKERVKGNVKGITRQAIFSQFIAIDLHQNSKNKQLLSQPSGSLHLPKTLTIIMDMRKVSCAVLIVAASMSAALAATEVPAPAPGPSSGASATVVGSLVGASVLSFFALFH
ncbi:unnamed protein product [Sphenostylis stenocarpa]|uniref:Uncharacterized protein n=2 Tax=Phaseoleae TaxID=163735 RepID=A0AA86SN65_9FABA|nr:unnamed protein product [Sphenostylis stenocarpa]